MTARNGKGHFMKGASGNPGGRPNVVGEVQVLARAHTVPAINALVEIMQDGDAHPGARVSAATALLDRGYGKAPQHLTGDTRLTLSHIERIIIPAGGGVAVAGLAEAPDLPSLPASEAEK